MDYYQEKSKKYAITSICTGALSFVCSSTILCILFRSHQGLSKPSNRLLMGMCIGDMISSLTYILSIVMVPSDVDYMVWNASGNQASCDAQGFLSMFGIILTSGYNCALLLCYLAIIKYNKKDDYIRAKLEPWMHSIPITLALAVAIAGIVNKVYNPGLVNCFIGTYHPPHCDGIDDGIIPDGYDIPCGRGSSNYQVFYYIMLVKNLGILPGIIMGSMMIMYKHVRASEKKMQKFRKSTFHRRAHQGSNLYSDHEDNKSANRGSKRLSGSMGKFFSMTTRLSDRILGRDSTQQDPSSVPSKGSTKNSRTIMYRALAYAMAYFATYLFPIVIMIERLVAGDSFGFSVRLYLAFFFHPLQGLFNFLVFMYPKVMKARGISGGDLSWCQAFAHALTSRGEKSRKRGSSAASSVPRSRRGNASRRSSSDNKKKKMKQTAEEEKREEEGSLCYSLPLRKKRNDKYPNSARTTMKDTQGNKESFLRPAVAAPQCDNISQQETMVSQQTTDMRNIGGDEEEKPDVKEVDINVSSPTHKDPDEHSKTILSYEEFPSQQSGDIETAKPDEIENSATCESSPAHEDSDGCSDIILSN